MTTIYRRTPLLLCWLVCAALVACGNPPPTEWTQFRGNQRDGTSTAEIEWPESGPKIAWKKNLGAAFSQLAAADGGIYTGTSDDVEDFVVKLDLETGEEIWRTSLGEVFQDTFGNGPRTTPTLDQGALYMLSGKGRFVALNAEDGVELWSVNLVEALEAEQPRFGFGGQPLVVGDLVVIETGGPEGKGVSAFDKASGEVRWSMMEGGAGYSSPVIAKIAGVSQLIVMREETLHGVTLEEEPQVLWEHPLIGGTIAMPLAVEGDRIFVSAAGDDGCEMLQVTRDEATDEWSVASLWANRDMRNHFNSSVYRAGSIYGFDNATLKSLSADTGEVQWAKRGLGKGSLLLAGDDLIVLTDKGEVRLVEATAEEYREKGALQVLDGKSWTAPSLADGRLLVRNLEQAACLSFEG